MGLFISVNGWTQGVITTLKLNKDRLLILANGECIRGVLEKGINLKDLIEEKIRYVSIKAEPFCSIEDYLKERRSGAAK